VCCEPDESKAVVDRVLEEYRRFDVVRMEQPTMTAIDLITDPTATHWFTLLITLRVSHLLLEFIYKSASLGGPLMTFSSARLRLQFCR
jgi:hypothetical protein